VSLTPFQGFLAALADSDFSAVFYIAASYQLLVAGLGCFARVRVKKWYLIVAGVSHLLLPIFLVMGVYHATQPPA
jgi:hypothetical protein